MTNNITFAYLKIHERNVIFKKSWNKQIPPFHMYKISSSFKQFNKLFEFPMLRASFQINIFFKS